MGSSSIERLAAKLPDAGAICDLHRNFISLSEEYAEAARLQSVKSAAGSDPRWSWPGADEAVACMDVLSRDGYVAIGNEVTSEDAQALAGRLFHPDPCVRIDAVAKLKELEAGAAEVAHDLGRVIADRDEYPFIRAAAMDAATSIWGILAHPAASAMDCVAGHEGEDMGLRRAAVEALSAIATNATTRALEDIALGDSIDVSLRLYAVEMIVHAESNNSLDALEELVDIMAEEIVERALSGASIEDACEVYEQGLISLSDVSPDEEEEL